MAEIGHKYLLINNEIAHGNFWSAWANPNLSIKHFGCQSVLSCQIHSVLLFISLVVLKNEFIRIQKMSKSKIILHFFEETFKLLDFLVTKKNWELRLILRKSRKSCLLTARLLIHSIHFEIFESNWGQSYFLKISITYQLKGLMKSSSLVTRVTVEKKTTNTRTACDSNSQNITALAR